ncbi:MAG: sulfite exporter TauE/SafE family protein [Proteobacteria bacterium]|nr:sulfite exporter TauE/SafE family protein [Pseudomonadota bacterium]
MDPSQILNQIEPLQLLLLFCVGCIAGFLNVMAGGGSAISLPILIFMGLDSTLANGTNRVAIFIQNLFAIGGFRKQKFHQFNMSLPMAICTLPGAFLGAWVAVKIDDQWFHRILAIVMIGIVISMLVPKSKTRTQNESSRLKTGLGYLAMLGIGFYGGFIQVGVGFIMMAVMFHLFQMNLIHVNMHKVFIIFVYTIPALAIFIYSGNVNWSLGLTLAAGNAIGGVTGSFVTVKGGEKIVRYVLIIAILFMSAKLLISF